MRSEANTVDCDDPVVALACLDPEADMYKECPAACREDASDNTNEDGEVVKSGSLAVSSSAADDRSVVVATDDTLEENADTSELDGAVSDLDTLTFKTSEEVTIQKVVLEKYGYSTASDLVKRVWLEDEDGKEISNKAKPNSKGLVNLTIKKDYKKVDGTFNATIVVETLVNAKVGGTLGFKVVDVNSTAKDVDLGNYKAYTYDVVAYDGTKAKVTAKGGEKDYNYEGEAVEISKFKIKAPDDSAIVITSLTLTNAEEATIDINDTIDAEDVEVSIDGKTVKANVSINKDEEMSISLKEPLELSARQQVQVVVSAKFNSDFEDYGHTVILEIAKASDISATDKNNARITVDLSGAAGKWIVYTINGGQVKITNTKLGNVDAALNSTDVLIAEGYITVGEDLEDGKLIVEVKGENPDAIEAMRLEIAGDEYDGEHNNAYTTWTFSNIEISESGKIRLYVDTNSDTTEANVAKWEGKSYTFSFQDGANDGWDHFHYVNGDKNAYADPSGSLTISKLNIQAPEGTLVNNLSSSDDVEFPNKELNTEIVFEGTYKADKQNVYLNSFSLIRSDAYDHPSKVRFYLYVDDMETSVADVTVKTNDGLTGWSDDFNDILVKAGETVKVKVEAEVDAKEAETDTGAILSGKIGKFDVVLEGSDENDNPAGYAKRKTSNIVVVKKGSATVEEGDVAKNVVLRKASGSKIAQFVVKPDSANKVTLEEISFDLTFTKAGTEDYEGNVDLYVNGSNKNLKGPSSSKNGAYKAEFSTDVDSKGVTVTVELDDEFDGEVSLTNLKVNDNEIKNKDFNKKFVEAVVWFTDQKSDDDNTTFKFGIDKKGSATIQNLTLILKNNTEVVINNGNDIKENTPYDVVNLPAQQDVVGMKYTVDGTVAPTAPASGTEIVPEIPGTPAVIADGTHCYNADGTTKECGDDTPVATGTVVVATGDVTPAVIADGTQCYNADGTTKECGAAEGYITISNKYADMFKIGMKEDGAQVRVARQKD